MERVQALAAASITPRKIPAEDFGCRAYTARSVTIDGDSGHHVQVFVSVRAVRLAPLPLQEPPQPIHRADDNAESSGVLQKGRLVNCELHELVLEAV